LRVEGDDVGGGSEAEDAGKVDGDDDVGGSGGCIAFGCSATKYEGSTGDMAVTEATVAEGMQGAAAANETFRGALGAGGAMLAFFLAATESIYCFMLFVVGSSLANDLASPSWRSSPIPTPTTRSTRRRAALPAPRGPALACRSLDTRSSQLHAAACPACCTAL